MEHLLLPRSGLLSPPGCTTGARPSTLSVRVPPPVQSTSRSRAAVSGTASATLYRSRSGVPRRCNANRRLVVRAQNDESSPVEVIQDYYDEEGPVTPPPRLVVLGGNGFVGSAVCKAALAENVAVTSVNRSGAPSTGEEWVDKVTWQQGDVFDESSWKHTLPGAVGVVSCLGGFGSNEEMQKVCGDATVAAVAAASSAGVPHFAFVSVHAYDLPGPVLQLGYFDGKKRAEAAVLDAYPPQEGGGGGTVLRPGFIYGDRVVPQLNNAVIPLGLLGRPLESILQQEAVKPLTSALSQLPGSDLLLAPPVDVVAVGKAAVLSALGRRPDPLSEADTDSVFGVLDIDAIQTLK